MDEAASSILQLRQHDRLRMVAVAEQRVLEEDEKIWISVIFEFQDCGHYQEEEKVSIRSAALRLDTPVELFCVQCDWLARVTGRTIKMQGRSFAV